MIENICSKVIFKKFWTTSTWSAWSMMLLLHVSIAAPTLVQCQPVSRRGCCPPIQDRTRFSFFLTSFSMCFWILRRTTPEPFHCRFFISIPSVCESIFCYYLTRPSLSLCLIWVFSLFLTCPLILMTFGAAHTDNPLSCLSALQDFLRTDISDLSVLQLSYLMSSKARLRMYRR